MTQPEAAPHQIIALLADPERIAQWELSVRGFEPRKELTIAVLSGKSTDSFNDIEHANEVVPEKVSRPASAPLLLPPHSVSIVQFST